MSQKIQVLGMNGGNSEEHIRYIERQVYLYGRKTLFDKIYVIFSPLILFVFVQNVGYGGEGSGEAKEEIIMGQGLERKENSVSFVKRCM